MQQRLKNIVITDVSVDAAFPSESRHEFSAHHHYCLCICSEGQANHLYSGNPDIFGKNHAIIFPEKQLSSFFQSNDECSFITFSCLGFLCDSPIILPIESPGTYLRDYEQMKLLAHDERNRLKIFGIFYSMLHNLLSMPISGILLPALRYIEDNYKNPELSISEIAKQCHISEVYFRKLFVAQYHIPPKQFLINIRMNRAKELLTEGHLKISAIAVECGFTSPYHFCRAFKNQIGITPTEYLLRHRTDET